MNERQMQFRVGLFVIVSMGVLAALVLRFSQLEETFREGYTVSIHFESAPGIYPSSPVRMNGITIGRVREVVLDHERGGVTVVADVRRRYRLREDSRPVLVRTLLGDTSIEFSPGSSPHMVDAGAEFEGTAPPDPMQAVQRLETRLVQTMDSLTATSRQWERVAQNVNRLLEGNDAQIAEILDRSGQAVDQFRETLAAAETALKNANALFADPDYRAGLRRTLEALPEMTRETRETIAAVRETVETLNTTLENLRLATAPLAKRGDSIAAHVDGTLRELEMLSRELNRFSRVLAREDGSLQRLASDPDLYRDLERSARTLALLLENLQPVIADLRIFSDKVARHPELLGIRGAITGSTGLKDELPQPPLRRAGRATVDPVPR